MLGADWRALMEKELDYFALVHFAPEPGNGEGGVFEMLPPMVEFAAQKYQDSEYGAWEKTWVGFWRQQIGTWDQGLSGRLPDGIEVAQEDRRAVAERRQEEAKILFGRTEANWLHLFSYALEKDCSLTKELLLKLVSFCELSGQRVLLRSTAQAAVQALRQSGSAEDLAPCIGTLGNVQSELGEREEAKDRFLEALQLYESLASRWPTAFMQYLFIVLRNYTTVAEENPTDRWWQLWKKLQEQAARSPDQNTGSEDNPTS